MAVCVSACLSGHVYLSRARSLSLSPSLFHPSASLPHFPLSLSSVCIFHKAMDVNARRHANPDGMCDPVCTVW